MDVWNDPAILGQAVLCGADLRSANLEGADLRSANLKDADLRKANLKGADLGGANLEGTVLRRANLKDAYLGDANLEGADLLSANLKDADLRRANLKDAYLGDANLEGADLSRANLEGAVLDSASYLKGAVLHWANLEGADLQGANLKGADLEGASLEGANLDSANLEGAVLRRANLKGAVLLWANLEGANLYEANLEGANLSWANLEGANFEGANLENSRLASTNLHNVIYAPASPPPNGYLEGIKGLATVTFPLGRQSGLVQFRELLQKSGLRDLERQATFAIEHNKALHERQRGSLVAWIGGWVKLIFFEWTTGWGLNPSRAVAIMLVVIVGMSVVYTVPIATPPAVASDRHGIFRVWPRERLEPGEAGIAAADNIRVDRLTAKVPSVFAWAFYFSMLSAFHIGWRDLNVGSWITRIQPTEFALRGRGWVRIVSGVQSLISVYLVAMWVLTYFGRPFQ